VSKRAESFPVLNPKRFSYELHRAVLAVGFFTGHRSAEIRGLRVNKLGSVNGIRVLNLQIKGDRRHEIPLHRRFFLFQLTCTAVTYRYLKLQSFLR
jgi:hypothetical protein